MKTKRERYLNLLINKKHNELIIVITNMRKCEKSYFLFTIFKRGIITNDTPASYYNKKGHYY